MPRNVLATKPRTDRDRLCALSLPQPLAWCVVHAAGRVGRDWWPTYRGPLLIHASRDMSLAEHRAASEWVRTRTGVLVPGPRDTEARGLAFGALLARAELVDVRLHDTRGHQVVSDHGRCLFCARCERLDLGGDCPNPDPWARGRYTFVFEDLAPFAVPVPWRGRQGLWPVYRCDTAPDDCAALSAALARAGFDAAGIPAEAA
jgi:hypothetical protein